MFSEDFRLPDPWENYLQHIERTSANFWERERRYKDYVRLQNIKIWRELRSWLLTIESGLVDKDHQLTAFETFLLHAATYLYEIGFQEVDVRQSGLTEGYIASGRRILKCRMPDRGETDFGLSSLDDSTISILAKLCAAVGTLDLPSLKLSSRPEPGGFGQMVRLRYLIALLQLADLLFVKDRANEGVLYSLSPLDTANLADARLALQGYISGVDLQKEGLTLYLKIHLSDEYLDKKMYALFVEPLRVWWSYNWKWLFRDFGFFLTFQQHDTAVNREGGGPQPLSHTCWALKRYLEGNFHASDVRFPASTSDVVPIPPLSKSDVSVSATNTSGISRNNAFISCSQSDRKFLKELQTHLKPHIRKDGLHIWDETKILPGSRWKQEIEQALKETKVAVVLVSADFLASDFIADKVLPPLLAAAEREGATILPVILESCAFEDSDLVQFRPANALTDPLGMMTPGQRAILWTALAKQVRDALKMEL